MYARAAQLVLHMLEVDGLDELTHIRQACKEAILGVGGGLGRWHVAARGGMLGGPAPPRSRLRAQPISGLRGLLELACELIARHTSRELTTRLFTVAARAAVEVTHGLPLECADARRVGIGGGLIVLHCSLDTRVQVEAVLTHEILEAREVAQQEDIKGGLVHNNLSKACRLRLPHLEGLYKRAEEGEEDSA